MTGIPPVETASEGQARQRELADHQVVRDRLAFGHLLDERYSSCAALIAHVARPLCRHVARAWPTLAADVG